MAGPGFKAKTPAQRSEAARKGGRAAHQKGTAHEWTSAEGRAAALKAIANRKAREAAGTSATATTPAQG